MFELLHVGRFFGSRFLRYAVFLVAAKSSFVLLCFVFILIGLFFPSLIVLSPAVSATAVLAFGRYVSRSFSLLFVVVFLLFSFLASLGNFLLKVPYDNLSQTLLFDMDAFSWVEWLKLNSVSLSLGWVFDSLAVNMLVLVSSVSVFVHLYSVNYMWSDPGLLRFLTYLSFFTFFMFVLAASPNFIQFFFGWEGIGLMSYLLIGFWRDRQQASKSSLKAVYVNRLGDFFLILALAVVYIEYQTFDFQHLFNSAHTLVDSTCSLLGTITDCFGSVSEPGVYIVSVSELISFTSVPYLYTELLAFFFFISAAAKSAQLGMHAWLPDAMEGPTPVSALIHAATMVTAGVYLLIRCSPILCLSFLAKYYMAFFGAITCIYAGLVACVQSDAKKLVAYSTMSQLGYMLLGCSGSNFSCSFFHLWVHGYVKALLFLAIGVVIHFLGDEQSMLRFGSLQCFRPFLFISLLVGSVSLMAIPLFSGYFSKEALIGYSSFSPGFGLGGFVFSCGLAGSFFTGLYSTKLACLVFLGSPNCSTITIRNALLAGGAPMPSFWVFLPLLSLLLGSLFFGLWLSTPILGSSAGYISYVSVLPFFDRHAFSLLFGGFEGESLALFLNSDFYFLPWAFAVYSHFVDHTSSVLFGASLLSPLLSAAFGVLVGVALYVSSLSFFWRTFSARTFMLRKLYFDRVINSLLCYPALRLFHNVFWQSLDKGVLEWFGPSGIVRLFLYIGRAVVYFQGRGILFQVAILIWSSLVLFFCYAVI